MSLWLAGCGPTNGLPPLTGEFLYIGNRDGKISEFSINTATGLLTNIGTFNIPLNIGEPDAVGAIGLVVHPTNEFIYAASDGVNGMLGFDIGDEGFSGTIFRQNSDVPSQLPAGYSWNAAVTPNGEFLYATNVDAGLV
jgi:DNA-binding beta-propeller fold protein YncE